MMGSSVEEEQAKTEEIGEVEMPLVWKMRRLVKAGEAKSVQERVTVKSTWPGRDGAYQQVIEPSKGDGAAVVWEEMQAALPIVMVSFETVPEEEPQA